MRALAGEQWPAAANAHAVVRRAVFVLPVAVVVVSVPGRSRLCAAADQCIDDAHRVSYSLIVRITQAEPDEREGIGAHEMFVARAVRADGTVANGDIARGQRVRASTRVPGLRRRDARVVAVNSGKARELVTSDQLTPVG